MLVDAAPYQQLVAVSWDHNVATFLSITRLVLPALSTKVIQLFRDYSQDKHYFVSFSDTIELWLSEYDLSLATCNACHSGVIWNNLESWKRCDEYQLHPN